MCLKVPGTKARHSGSMLAPVPSLSALWATCPAQIRPAGTLLMRRGDPTVDVLYLEAGQVVQGVQGNLLPQGALLEHPLGTLTGPCWLDAAAAVLAQPAAMDAVAQTEVQLRAVPLRVLQAMLTGTSHSVLGILLDMARAHREQTELAVSRLAKGAEARFAEWLLRHAQSTEQGECSVQLQQRKRLIAVQLGIAPETLSRVLRHLREGGLISGSGRVVQLMDPDGLRALAGA